MCDEMRKRSATIIGMAVALAGGCGGGEMAPPGGDGGGTGGDLAVAPGPDLAGPTDSDAGPPPDDLASAPAPDLAGMAMKPVDFHYRPQWKGVTTVAVIGAFGAPNDWTKPFLTLTDDGKGTFSGTAQLPAGKYAYAYRVIGDVAGAMPATVNRLADDPENPDAIVCPAGSPLATQNAANTCSQLTVPQATAPPLHHVTGKVTYDGKPQADWLVMIERDEPTQHHVFANRSTSAIDGSYDLVVASGTYRLQVLHPTFYNKTDVDRAPLVLQAMRRTLSSGFAVAGAFAVPASEVAYHDYPKLMPTGTATLPVGFKYSVVAPYTTARAAVYGGNGGMLKNIGDPWWASAFANSGAATWDGKFTTMQAMEMQAKAGEQYYWGTWQQLPKMNGVQWQGESMVFPIKF